VLRGRRGVKGKQVLLFSPILGLDEGDIVPLDHDPSERLPRVTLQMDLIGIIQDEVHVLVESGDDSLNAGVHVLVQPQGHHCPVLETTQETPSKFTIIKKVQIARKTEVRYYS
jgi:hypothetical protein